jgi:hypothetical protein
VQSSFSEQVPASCAVTQLPASLPPSKALLHTKPGAQSLDEAQAVAQVSVPLGQPKLSAQVGYWHAPLESQLLGAQPLVGDAVHADEQHSLPRHVPDKHSTPASQAPVAA